jgi:hypothetical protein
MISCVHRPIKESGSIADKIIEAYGGRERLAKVVSVAAEGRITTLMRDEAGIYRQALRKDQKLFIEVLNGRSTERRILDSTRGFQGADGRVEEVFGPRYHAMVDQFNELNLPFGLIDNTFSITELRKVNLQGADVRGLRLLDRAGNEIVVYVSTADHLIVKCMSTFENGLDSMNLSTEFSDFRSVGGILFPFRIVNHIGGQLISDITITAYLLNEPIADTFFKP